MSLSHVVSGIERGKIRLQPSESPVVLACLKPALEAVVFERGWGTCLAHLHQAGIFQRASSTPKESSRPVLHCRTTLNQGTFFVRELQPK